MAAIIGIKIANGEFYPIVEENSQVKKRLILTTVHDKQKSMQIDLYKSFTKTMADALYIGSLLMEDIRARPKGEPSIELIITSTFDGNITADARDLDPSSKGEHQSLHVSLKSLDDDDRDNITDFDLDTSSTVPNGLYENASRRREEKRQKFPWLAAICIALILTAIGLAVWLLLLRGTTGTELFTSRPPSSAVVEQEPAAVPPVASVPPAATPTVPPAAAVPPAEPERPAPLTPTAVTPPAVTTPPVTPPPVIQAPVTAPVPAPVQRRRNPPVASYRVPAVIPREGAAYTIRWGDTLWDIAEAFYRNPWLYPRIARFNNIRNPDLIISGRTIRVPPRN